MDIPKIKLKDAPPFPENTDVKLTQFNLAIGGNGVGKTILMKHILYTFMPSKGTSIFSGDEKYNPALRKDVVEIMKNRENEFKSIRISESRGFIGRDVDVSSGNSLPSLFSKSNSSQISSQIAFNPKVKKEILELLKFFNSKIIEFEVTTNGLKAIIKINDETKSMQIMNADGFAFASFIEGLVNLFLYKDVDKLKGIFIEEPENHLTPTLQVKFIQWLIAFCKQNDKMLYVNSHSPYIFREFIEHYKNPEYTINRILKENEYSKISRITEGWQIEEILKDFMLFTGIQRTGADNFLGAFEINFDKPQ